MFFCGRATLLTAALGITGCALCGYKYTASARLERGAASAPPSAAAISDVVISAVTPFGVRPWNPYSDHPDFANVVGDSRSAIVVSVDPTNGTISVVDSHQDLPSPFVDTVQNAIRNRVHDVFGVNIQFNPWSHRVTRCELGP